MGSTSLVCYLLAKDLLYPLSVKYRAGKDQDPVKMLKIQCLLFVFIRISVKQPLLCHKSLYKKTLISYKSLLC